VAVPESLCSGVSAQQGVVQDGSKVLCPLLGVGAHWSYGIPPAASSARTHIHNVFHVEFLRRFEGTTPIDVPPLPPNVCGRVVPQSMLLVS
jgi:hypothetical protein